MARIYAGILGPLAFLATIVHGMVHRRQEEAILLAAWWNLLIFAAIGGVLGWIAERTVEESISTTVSRQLEAYNPPEHADKPGPSAAKPTLSDHP